MRQQTAEHLENSLFFTSINNGYRACVVPFVSDHAVSHLHGTHSNLKIGDSVILINVKNEEIQLEASVHQISEPHDIIIFRLRTDQFEYFPRSTKSPYPGEHYKQLALQNGCLTWKEGCISRREFGFFVGSSYGVPGDSGSAILNGCGQLLGISIGKRTFNFVNWNQFPLMEMIDHFPDTRIVSVDIILATADIVNEALDTDQIDKSDQKCCVCGCKGNCSYESTNIRHDSGLTCYNCQETGHFSHDCPKGGSGGGQRAGGSCYNQKPIHISRNCPQREQYNGRRGGSTCYNCQKTGHFSRDCPKGGAGGDHRIGGSCYNCGGHGHYSRECPSARDGGNRSYGGRRGGDSRSFGGQKYYSGRQGHISRECTESGSAKEKRCYNCQGTGHISRDCPKNN